MYAILTLALIAAPQTTTSSRRLPAAQNAQFHAERPIFSERAAPALPFAPSLFGRGVAAGDLDRDGDVDFVIATATGAVIYINEGSSGFVDGTQGRLSQGLDSASLPLLADLNGDRWLDLVLLADAEPSADVVLTGNGQGGFNAPLALPIGETVTSDAELVDVDRDGDLDLVRATGLSGHGSRGGRDSLLLNDGSGGWSVDAAFGNAAWNSPTIPSTGVVSLDANRDGFTDLFFTRADSGSATGTPGAKNQLLLGSLQGQFIDASGSLPSLEDNSFDAVAIDLEGDGDLDLVVSNSVLGVSGASSGDVLVNQGGAQGGRAGAFADLFDAIDETPSIAESIRLGIHAADVDLDGRIDVLLRVHDLPPGGEQPLFLGRGLAFERAASFGTGTLIAAGATFADVDGDGDPDLLMTSAGSAAGGTSMGRARLFLNLTL